MKSNSTQFRALSMALFMTLATWGLSVHAQTYSCEVKNDRVIDNNHFRFTVWVKSNGSDIDFRAAQFTLWINHAFVNGTAKVAYVDGSSDLGAGNIFGKPSIALPSKGEGVGGDKAIIRLNSTSISRPGYKLTENAVRWAEFEVTRSGNGGWGCEANKLAFYFGPSMGNKVQSNLSAWTTTKSGNIIIPVKNGTYLNNHINNQTPVVTAPVSTSVVENNGTAQFSVSAINVNPGTSGVMTYQWMENGNPMSDLGSYSGATTPTLTIKNPSKSLDGNNYSCAVSLCGSVSSAAALLSVNSPAISETDHLLNSATGEVAAVNDNSSNGKNAGASRSGVDLNASQNMVIVASPNPANNKVTITFNSLVTSNYILRMMDVAGRIVMSQANAAGQGSNVVELNTSSLAEGTYMLSLIDANGSRQVKVNVKH